MYKALIHVTLKPGVLDAQGSAIKSALHSLTYEGVEDVRVGKFIELSLEAPSQEDAEQNVAEMCRRLLSNPVIEDYRFEVVKGS